MLAFAAKWSPFGGGDEYILPEFGLTPAIFYQRVLDLVTNTPTNDVDFATRNRLQKFCALELSRTRSGNRPVPQQA
nr:DUF3263 domain-containing protein [Rhodococcus sp. 14C212]